MKCDLPNNGVSDSHYRHTANQTWNQRHRLTEFFQFDELHLRNSQHIFYLLM